MSNMVNWKGPTSELVFVKTVTLIKNKNTTQCTEYAGIHIFQEVYILHGCL